MEGRDTTTARAEAIQSVRDVRPEKMEPPPLWEAMFPAVMLYKSGGRLADSGVADATAATIVRSAPTLATDNGATLFLRAFDKVLSEPVTLIRTLAGDDKLTEELGGFGQVLETAANFLAPIVLTGGVSHVLKGMVGAKAAASGMQAMFKALAGRTSVREAMKPMTARAGTVLIEQLALDVPGFVYASKDAGGFKEFGTQFIQSIGDGLNPMSNATPSQRTQSAMLVGLVALGGVGALRQVKATAGNYTSAVRSAIAERKLGKNQDEVMAAAVAADGISAAAKSARDANGGSVEALYAALPKSIKGELSRVLDEFREAFGIVEADGQLVKDTRDWLTVVAHNETIAGNAQAFGSDVLGTLDVRGTNRVTGESNETGRVPKQVNPESLEEIEARVTRQPGVPVEGAKNTYQYFRQSVSDTGDIPSDRQNSALAKMYRAMVESGEEPGSNTLENAIDFLRENGSDALVRWQDQRASDSLARATAEPPPDDGANPVDAEGPSQNAGGSALSGVLPEVAALKVPMPKVFTAEDFPNATPEQLRRANDVDPDERVDDAALTAPKEGARRKLAPGEEPGDTYPDKREAKSIAIEPNEKEVPTPNSRPARAPVTSTKVDPQDGRVAPLQSPQASNETQVQNAPESGPQSNARQIKSEPEPVPTPAKKAATEKKEPGQARYEAEGMSIRWKDLDDSIKRIYADAEAGTQGDFDGGSAELVAASDATDGTKGTQETKGTEATNKTQGTQETSGATETQAAPSGDLFEAAEDRPSEKRDSEANPKSAPKRRASSADDVPEGARQKLAEAEAIRETLPKLKGMERVEALRKARKLEAEADAMLEGTLKQAEPVEDPQFLADAIWMAKSFQEAGLDWQKELRNEFGDELRPYAGAVRAAMGGAKKTDAQGYDFVSTELDPKKIGVKPGMQYKKVGIDNGADAVDTRITDGVKWDPATAGPLTVWKDLDGNYWVMNGHHRRKMALDNNVSEVEVRVYDEADGVDFALARGIGAMQNIKDGKGTAIDAAGVIRDMGLTLDDLNRIGINTKKGNLGADAMALTKLPADMLRLVEDGKVRETVAAAFATVGLDDVRLREAFKQAERVDMTDRAVATNMAERLKQRPTVVTDDGTGNLFGEVVEASIDAEISALEIALFKRLSRDARVFKKVLTGRAAGETIIDKDAQLNEAQRLLEIQRKLGYDKPYNEYLLEVAKDYAEDPSTKNYNASIERLVEFVTRPRTNQADAGAKGSADANNDRGTRDRDGQAASATKGSESGKPKVAKFPKDGTQGDRAAWFEKVQADMMPMVQNFDLRIEGGKVVGSTQRGKAYLAALIEAGYTGTIPTPIRISDRLKAFRAAVEAGIDRGLSEAEAIRQAKDDGRPLFQDGGLFDDVFELVAPEPAMDPVVAAAFKTIEAFGGDVDKAIEATMPAAAFYELNKKEQKESEKLLRVLLRIRDDKGEPGSVVGKVGESVKAKEAKPVQESFMELGDKTGQYGLFQAADPVKVREARSSRLVALHNTSVDGLQLMLEWGGLPAPSIAILKPGMKWDGYGPVTLVMRRSAIDPKADSRNWVLDADGYTPRAPRPTYDVSTKAVASLVKLLPHGDPVHQLRGMPDLSMLRGDYAWSQPDGKKKFIDQALSSPGLLLAYLRDRGLPEPPVPMRRADMRVLTFSRPLASKVKKMTVPPYNAFGTAGVPDIQTWAKSALEDLLGDDAQYFLSSQSGTLRLFAAEGLYQDIINIRSGKEQVDTNAYANALSKAVAGKAGSAGSDYQAVLRGLRDPEYLKWVQEFAGKLFDNPTVQVGRRKLPYRLEAVVEAMGRQVRGVDANAGHGVARARGAKKFPSVEAIRAEADSRLVSPEEFALWKEANQSLWDAAVDLIQYPKGVSGFHVLDAVSIAVGRAISRGNATETGMRGALSREGVLSYVPEAAIDYLVQFANGLRNGPTEYFEAKPMRAVGIEEVAGAVVPKGTPKDLIQALRDRGLDVKEYDPDKGDRTTQVSSVRDALFQETNQGTVERLARMRQTARGEYLWDVAKGRGRLLIYDGADISTVVHEFAHHLLHVMPRADQKAIGVWAGVDPSVLEAWNVSDPDFVKAHERFARGVEYRLMTRDWGDIQNKTVRSAMERVGRAIHYVYNEGGRAFPQDEINVHPTTAAVIDAMVVTPSQRRDLLGMVAVKSAELSKVPAEEIAKNTVQAQVESLFAPGVLRELPETTSAMEDRASLMGGGDDVLFQPSGYPSDLDWATFAERSTTDKQFNAWKGYGRVGPKLQQILRNALGGEFEFAEKVHLNLIAQNVRHAINGHGANSNYAKNGAPVLGVEDFEFVPQLLSRVESTRVLNKKYRVVELTAGDVAVVLEVGRDNIIVKSMYGVGKRQDRLKRLLNEQARSLSIDPAVITIPENRGLFQDSDIADSNPLREWADTFYSQLGRQIDVMPQQRMTADQLRGWLKGRVKDEEMFWTGLDDFLDGKGNLSVTQLEVQEFLKQNRVMVLDSIYDGEYTAYGNYTEPGGTNYREILLQLPKVPFASSTRTIPRSHWKAQNVIAHARIKDRVDADGRRVMFVEEIQSDWHQKGRRDGYSDPTARKRGERAQRIDGDLHLERLEQAIELDDRIKQLELEGIDPDTLLAVKNRIDRAKRASYHEPQRVESILKQGLDDLSTRRSLKLLDVPASPWKIIEQAFYDAIVSSRAHLEKRADIERRQQEIQEDLVAYFRSEESVLAAPFMKTWPALTLKRLIRLAAEEGYDSIAWAPGELHRVRYNKALADNVDQIKVIQNGRDKDVVDVLGLQKGKAVLSQAVKRKNLSDLIGSKMAAEFESRISVYDWDNATDGTPGWDPKNQGAFSHVFEGEGLEVGGQGYKTFYDEIIPKVARELSKKFGGSGTVETINVKGVKASNVQGIAITPELRRSALEEGMPLFQGDETPEYDAGLKALLRAAYTMLIEQPMGRKEFDRKMLALLKDSPEALALAKPRMAALYDAAERMVREDPMVDVGRHGNALDALHTAQEAYRRTKITLGPLQWLKWFFLDTKARTDYVNRQIESALGLKKGSVQDTDLDMGSAIDRVNRAKGVALQIIELGWLTRTGKVRHEGVKPLMMRIEAAGIHPGKFSTYRAAKRELSMHRTGRLELTPRQIDINERAVASFEAEHGDKLIQFNKDVDAMGLRVLTMYEEYGLRPKGWAAQQVANNPDYWPMVKELRPSEKAAQEEAALGGISAPDMKRAGDIGFYKDGWEVFVSRIERLEHAKALSEAMMPLILEAETNPLLSHLMKRVKVVKKEDLADHSPIIGGGDPFQSDVNLEDAVANANLDGIFKEWLETTDANGGPIVPIARDGRIQHWQIDPLMWAAVRGQLPQQMTGTVRKTFKLLQFPAKVFRTFTTGVANPLFQIVFNPAIDVMSAMVGHGMKPGILMQKWARGFAVAMTEGKYTESKIPTIAKWSELYNRALLDGAIFLDGVNRDWQASEWKVTPEVASLTGDLRSRVENAPIIMPVRQLGARVARSVVGEAMSLVVRIPSAIEKATRIAFYDQRLKAYSKGKKKLPLAEARIRAAQDAINLMNFGERGAMGQGLTMVGIPYANIPSQVIQSMRRGYKRNPYTFVARSMLMLSIPALMEHFAHEDDPEYQDLPDYVKDGMLLWKIGPGEFRGLRIPAELGIFFKGIPRRLMEGLKEGDDAGAIGTRIRDSIVQEFIPPFMPTWASLAIQESFFQNSGQVIDAPFQRPVTPMGTLDPDEETYMKQRRQQVGTAFGSTGRMAFDEWVFRTGQSEKAPNPLQRFAPRPSWPQYKIANKAKRYLDEIGVGLGQARRGLIEGEVKETDDQYRARVHFESDLIERFILENAIPGKLDKATVEAAIEQIRREIPAGAQSESYDPPKSTMDAIQRKLKGKRSLGLADLALMGR